MRAIIYGLSAVALTAGLGGCATVTRGTSQQFTIESTPPGAQARTTSGFNCESTPCTIRMPRKDGFSVTVTKAGYKSVTVDVKPKIAGNGAAGFLGNALIGGVIGAAVDVGSGATLDLDPNPLHVNLEAAEAAPAAVAATPAPAATATPAATPPAPAAAPAAAAPATVAAKPAT
ncbi:translation initiation factor 2 [Phenylobacterium montanum]|uniref:Translation initiation factor 2 n=1 Tax=Phenylobacterium montanum TaxID=2823693 RepID=A0A975G393_9CAUL|nr:translation initiation factor 2 [Caulobacter sp. S6]QUD89201.1 translation initiation factor 2 [Caulobacter sp. S6]